ncbi:MAG: type II secretion system GspH family protein [Actinomycetota bacterium]|nr:type II secretion system GspH family protein [Actinomycetota bacterium]
MIRLRRRTERGFTLIEVLAALLVFSLITLGIVPLLATSMKAASLARTGTVAKNAGLKGMEHARDLPYYISYAAQNQRVDLLDMYFPGITTLNANQTYAGTPNYTFTTRCTSGSTIPGCPQDLPAGYEVTYVSQFVKPVEAGTNTVSYTPVAPAAGYSWNAAGNLDLPAATLVLMKVTTTWQAGGQPRSYLMTSLLSDRKFGEVRLQGSAKISYALQALTTYASGSSEAELIAKLGLAESNIQSRSASTATQIVTGGTLTLTESVTGNTNATLMDEYTGVDVAYDAPPNQTPSGSSASAGTVVNDDLSGSPLVAGLGGTSASGPSPGLEVTVANELPEARGGFSLDSILGQEDLWVDTQASYLDKHLNPAKHILSVRPRMLGTETGASGSTFAETLGLGTAGRGVATQATVTVNDVQLLPTTFIPTTPASVIQVADFAATVDCKATAVAATTVASPTWTATLKFWSDPTNNGNFTGSGYTTLNLAGNSTDVLGTYGPAAGQTNPLVYDGATNAEDIYLFEDTSSSKSGYLNGWSSLYNVTTTGFQKDVANGKTASADIGGALRIDTAPTDTAEATSALQLALGSLNCASVDRR